MLHNEETFVDKNKAKAEAFSMLSPKEKITLCGEESNLEDVIEENFVDDVNDDSGDYIDNIREVKTALERVKKNKTFLNQHNDSVSIQYVDLTEFRKAVKCLVTAVSSVTDKLENVEADSAQEVADTLSVEDLVMEFDPSL